MVQANRPFHFPVVFADCIYSMRQMPQRDQTRTRLLCGWSNENPCSMLSTRERFKNRLLIIFIIIVMFEGMKV